MTFHSITENARVALHTKAQLCGLAILGIAFGAAIALSSPAKAYDDDVEVVCWEHDDGETECMDVDDLAAECELADPEYTTDQCGGLLEDRVPASNKLTTEKKKRDDNHLRDDNDRGDKGRDDKGHDDKGRGGKDGRGNGGQKGPNG